MLFSRAEVAGFINANFEAAWETVRPVPIIRIDFGNGHVATRTLHGNIASYVCAADRHVVDVLPGIYTPGAYMAALGDLRDLHGTLGRGGQDWQRRLPTYHRERAQLLRSQPARIVYTRGVLTPPPPMEPPSTVAAPLARQGASASSARDSLRSGGVQGGGNQGGGFGGGDFGGGGFNGGGFQGGAQAGRARAFAGGGFKGGGEWRVEQIVTQAPGNVEGIAPRGPRPRPGTDLADWQPLAVDTWHNETQRRLLIHDRLADTTLVRPDQMKRWLYKEVLHADLDDPYLGLGDALFGDDVFGPDQ